MRERWRWMLRAEVDSVQRWSCLAEGGSFACRFEREVKVFRVQTTRGGGLVGERRMKQQEAGWR